MSSLVLLFPLFCLILKVFLLLWFWSVVRYSVALLVDLKLWVMKSRLMMRRFIWRILVDSGVDKCCKIGAIVLGIG